MIFDRICMIPPHIIRSDERVLSGKIGHGCLHLESFSRLRDARAGMADKRTPVMLLKSFLIGLAIVAVSSARNLGFSEVM